MVRKISFYIAVCVLITGIMLSLALIPLRQNQNSTSVFQNNPQNMPIVVIDAGHGGEDGGAQGSDGTLEKDINLAISLYLKEMLRLNGFTVKTVREDDISVCDDLPTVHERKVTDLKNRLSLFNDNEKNIVISIHQNKFEQEKYNGTQIFYSPNNPLSEILADKVKNSVFSLLQPTNTRENKKSDSSIYVLYNASVPAIIVECGFLSNESELKKLQQTEYQQQMAFSIFTGFLQFYSENWK